MGRILSAAAWSLALIVVAQPSPFTVRRGAVGSVAIGLSDQAIIAMFPPDRRRGVDLQLEGLPTPALVLTLAGSKYRDGVIAELGRRDGRVEVSRILVKDPMARTAKGIAVGSTVSALRAAYRVAWIGVGEGRVFLRVEELGASFELETPIAPHEQLDLITDPAKVPGGIKIVGILLTEAG